MAKLFIDNTAYEVDEGQNLLQACLSLKQDLPYFCWHPSMGSVGACRQCAVMQYKDEQDTQGKLIVACMTPVSDGMRIGLADEHARQFRDLNIAALMTHHPHDCPVCAEGGECHLQDMTVMSGHHNRYFKGKKTTFENQELGPLIKHEMNRCITCYRCVRFYQDYAGGKDLSAQASKNHVYFGRQCDGTLQSEFAGNLVEVCPTGVFTDKPFNLHYSRKWDLQASPSICQHCSVGCNITLSERYGSVRRVTNRLNPHLNGYFLCDRGRFGFGFVNSAERNSLIRVNGVQKPWNDESLQEILTDSGRWIGIGSSQASLEDNFALQQLVGTEYFCISTDANREAMLMAHCDILKQQPMASLAEIEQADAVLILAEDLNNSAPRAALAVRQALLNKAKSKAESLGVPVWQDAAVRELLPSHPTPLIHIGWGESPLVEQATTRILCNETEAVAVAGALCNKLAPEFGQPIARPDCLSEAQLDTIVDVLSSAKRPLIIGGWSAANAGLLRMAANIHSSLGNEHAMLALFPDEANDIGLGMLAQRGYLSCEALQNLMDEENCNLLVLDHAGAQSLNRLERIHKHARHMVRLSQLGQKKEDEVTLPISSFSEASGSSVNYQGVVQSYYPATKPDAHCMPAWQWLINIAKLRHHNLKGVSTLGQLRQAMSEDYPLIAPHFNETHSKTALQPPRASGRTAMLANQTMHEPKPYDEEGAPYKQSMEGVPSQWTAADMMPFSWAPGWNSNQSNHKFRDEYAAGDDNHKQPGTRVFRGKAERKWLVPDQSPNQSKTALSGNTLAVLPQLRVFGSDSLSVYALPVLALVGSAEVAVHPKVRDRFNLQREQYVCVNDLETVFQLNVSEKVPDDRVSVFLPADMGDEIIECSRIVPATAERVKEHMMALEARKTSINEHQHMQLNRLFNQDQTIPIRFIEGVAD